MNNRHSWRQRSFFEERPTFGLGIFRLCLVGTVAVHMAPSLLSLRDTFYDGAHRITSPFYPQGFLELVGALPDAAVYVAAIIFWMAILACLLGLKARFSLLVLLLCCGFFDARNSLSVGMPMLGSLWAVLIPVICFPGLGDALSVENFWKGGVAWTRKRPFTVQRLLQLQLTWVFWYAALGRFTHGGNWITENPLHYLMRYPQNGAVRDFPLRDWLAGQGEVCYVLGLAWITLELAVPLMWWFRKTRTAGLLLGVGYHGVLWGALYLPAAFHLLSLGMMLLFIPPERYMRWFEHRRALNAARKRPRMLYDGDCAFCRASVDRAAALDPTGRVAFEPAQGIGNWASLPHGVTRERCLEEVVWIGRKGDVHGGFDAFRQLAAQLLPLWPLVPVLWVPGVPCLGRRIYRWAASRRYLLMRGDGGAACSRHA